MHTDNTALADPPGPAIDLDSLYAAPAERIQKAVRDRLSDFHEAYLRQASFFCLATAGERGLDASPRGGPPGFVQVLDERTVAFADWPGNNRIESLRNLQADDRLAMLFLFPGLDIFLRINGRGRISTDPHLLQELSEGRGTPRPPPWSWSTRCCCTAARPSTAPACGTRQASWTAPPCPPWAR